MGYRVEEVDSDKVAQMTKGMVDFGVVVSAKDKNKFLELNDKFEKFLDFYKERGKKINQL